MRPTVANLLFARRMTLIAVVTICVSIAASLIASAGQRPGSARSAPQPLLLAVTPNLTGPVERVGWDELATHISQRSGREVQIIQPKTQAEFEGCLAQKAYDLVLAFPHQLAEADLIRQPIVQLEHRPRGLIVVRADSDLFQLSDLDRTTVAIPAVAMFAANRLVPMELASRGADDPVLPLSDAETAYDALLFGQVAASSGTPVSFNRLPDHVRARLRVIHQTERHAPAGIYPLTRISSLNLDRLEHAFRNIRYTSPVLYGRTRFFGFETAEADHAQPDLLPAIPAVMPAGRGCPLS